MRPAGQGSGEGTGSGEGAQSRRAAALDKYRRKRKNRKFGKTIRCALLSVAANAAAAVSLAALAVVS